MGHQVRILLACMVLASVFAGCKPAGPTPEEAAAAAQPQTSKGGTGIAQQAPEMLPPEGAPTADDVVGSKLGG